MLASYSISRERRRAAQTGQGLISLYQYDKIAHRPARPVSNTIMYFIGLGINPVAYAGFVNYRHCVKVATHTHFLNVDLDIFSKRDLQPLLTPSVRRCVVLYSGRHGQTYRAHVELARITKAADRNDSRFLCLG